MAKKQTSQPDSVLKPQAPVRKRSHNAKHSKAAVSAPPEPAPISESEIVQAAAGVLYDHDAIATLAYSYWEARGCQGGSEAEDWLRAEKEFMNRQKLAGNL